MQRFGSFLLAEKCKYRPIFSICQNSFSKTHQSITCWFWYLLFLFLLFVDLFKHLLQKTFVEGIVETPLRDQPVHHDPSPCCWCEKQDKEKDLLDLDTRKHHPRSTRSLTTYIWPFGSLTTQKYRLEKGRSENPVTNTHRGRRQLFTLGVKIASYHWNKALMSLLCICCICRVFHHSLNWNQSRLSTISMP